ncbi:hypothetical protein V6615_12635 [Oscillospiraceae bacterium PP1C4]
MNEEKDKAQIIKENIEATIMNAIQTEKAINETNDPKTRQQLQAKNEGRAQAIPSLIRDMKEAEALKQL